MLATEFRIDQETLKEAYGFFPPMYDVLVKKHEEKIEEYYKKIFKPKKFLKDFARQEYHTTPEKLGTKIDFQMLAWKIGKQLFDDFQLKRTGESFKEYLKQIGVKVDCDCHNKYVFCLGKLVVER